MRRLAATFATVALVPAALQSQDSTFAQREIAVVPSPRTAQRLTLAANQRIVDFDIWPTGAQAAIVVRDASGASRVVDWRIGEASAPPLVDLPQGFEPRAIAVHPLNRQLFVAGRRGAKSQILSLALVGTAWRTVQVFESPRELRRLVVGPRPFLTDDGLRYRLFFGEQMSAGVFATRSVTESGKIEYQAVGPRSTVIKVANADEQPNGAIATSALPAAFHPSGHILLWQDGAGCFRQIAWGDKQWGKTGAIPGNVCDGSLTVTPNGAALLHWRAKRAGVDVILDHGRATQQQATDYTFLGTPSSVPDGRGVIGEVADPAGPTLVYAPINVPLADVVNAWMFVEHAEDGGAFARNGGLFRPLANDQLFQLYDSESYYCGGYDMSTPTRPYLVTTDVMWEVFGAAYEGTFIVQERNVSMPAFWSFIDAANAALQRSAPASPWAKGIAAIAESRGTPRTTEAVHIATATTALPSEPAGGSFDFGELKPRGHYTATPEMSKYFRGVHYLTELGKLLDAKPLAALPVDVQQKARVWTSSYMQFIAPSRAPLVWSGPAVPVPAYTQHPNPSTTVFPLSWGFDNEVLLSTVFHSAWPVESQIAGPGGERLLASGLDLAAAMGGGFARTLLAPDLASYPPLGRALDALTARRPPSRDSETVYDKWLNALAVEWADNSTFPGTDAASKLWSTKRLQTGLASWATLRHATVLVNERTSGECGEAGFEELVLRPPRGYVEPAPKTFAAIAGLFDGLSRIVASATGMTGTLPDSAAPLREGILKRLAESAAKSHLYESIGQKELHGEALTDREYEEILYLGRVAEHHFLVYKSLANKNLALSQPEPMMKIADVAGGAATGILNSAVGRPLEWDQVVPYFGRREIVKGSVYSYYEFTSPSPLNDIEWRAMVDKRARPAWVTPFLSPSKLSCPAVAPF